MRYLSVCSGIEAATVAWHPLGWTPVAFSEIEAFPAAVLAHHYPDVPNLGDMTRFHDWPDASIDLLVGGTPCQSFSVAGLRKGLDDPRGNLMLTYLAIARRYRPRWVVWENVPGVLSSNGGRDFGTFLGGLAELGYGFAYRVLDAQYVRVESHPRAVPQRRRRVFVVGHLGDWRRAAAVLFERESLCGHPAPRREAGQRPAPTIASRPSGGGGLGTDFDCDGGLVLECRQDGTANAVLTPNGGRGGIGVGAIAFGWNKSASQSMRTGDTTDALQASESSNPAVAQHIRYGIQVRRLTPLECERLQGFPDGYTAIPMAKRNRAAETAEMIEYFRRTGQDDALRCGAHMAADGPRYKALGNSMAVNVMRWIGERIEIVDALRTAA